MPVQPGSAGAAELAALLARAADGDVAAFRQFHDRTSAKLFGVILRILPEREEAEDVLQDVYVTLWRKAGSFDASRASPITWAATVARNRAIDRLRARPARAVVPVDEAGALADDAPPADVVIARSQQAAALHAALATLEPRHAAAIRACHFEGLTYEALAMREGVPVGTLKSWVRRGLVRLRARLDGDGA